MATEAHRRHQSQTLRTASRKTKPRRQKSGAIDSRLWPFLVGGRRNKPWLHRLRQILDSDLLLSRNVAVHHVLDLRGRHGLEFCEVGVDAVRVTIHHDGLAKRARFTV